jgi:phenylacetate-CoA ligase
MNKTLELLYARSPILVQEVALNAYATRIHFQRFGRNFKDTLEQWHQTQWLSYRDLIELQNEKLRKLMRHAFETVPYYQRIMKDRKLSPSDFKVVRDLAKLPPLTREDVRSHSGSLISCEYRPRQLVKGHTSGTTGSPLQFYWDKNTCFINNIADWRQKNWAGLNYGDPHAVLLGRTIVPIAQRKPPFWRMNYLQNQLWLSSFHMTEANLSLYLAKLEKFRPVALEGYPSTLFILAKYLESRNKMFPVKAVLTSSETLHETQRETIEKAFGCRVFDFYGLAERTMFATECEKHEGHHVNMEYGIVEVINDEGSPVGDGEMGRLVGTSLHNFGMPFIRYETNDISSILPRPCSCGRGLPLMADVATKAEDIVVTPDGRFISPSVLTHPFKPLHGIKLSQIVQEDVKHLVVKIVQGSEYSHKEAELLVAALKQRLGEEMSIDIQIVESIPRTAAGKFRWVISKVPLKF